MKKFLKTYLILFISIFITFSTGCSNKEVSPTESHNSIKISQNNNKTQKLKEETIKEKKDDKKHSDDKNSDINKITKPSEDKKENVTETDEKLADKNLNVDISEKNNSPNNEVVNSSKKTNSTEENKAKKEVAKIEKNTEIDEKEKEDTFTMIIAKELKGYTDKESEIIDEVEVKISENKNAMTYLRENFDMKDKGGFIYEISEIHNIYPIPESKKTPEQKELGVLGVDWFIYLNDKKTPVGANDVYPVKGDVLLFDFHEWDKREFSPSEY